MKLTKIIALTAGVVLLPMQVAQADIGNTATQQVCNQSGSDSTPLPATANAQWSAGGLNRSLDRTIYKRDIIAYKIMWSTGWSGWFVKGVNDLYSFATPSATVGAIDARLAWIYFYDHQHQYISCNRQIRGHRMKLRFHNRVSCGVLPAC